jgi:hypothetical protein
MLEVNSTLVPFSVFCVNIVGHENYLTASANQFVFGGIRRRSHQRYSGSSIWRIHRDPATAVVETRIDYEIESQLVYVEAQASVLIANEDGDVVKT